MSQDSMTETDERFPSGSWVGFFLQPRIRSSRPKMELVMSFRNGGVSGSGSDLVGVFSVKGQYDLDSGEVTFNKKYYGQHDVYYRGFADGTNRGIWGTWEIGGWDRGGFHIWPKGTGNSESLTTDEQASQPIVSLT